MHCPLLPHSLTLLWKSKLLYQNCLRDNDKDFPVGQEYTAHPTTFLYQDVSYSLVALTHLSWIMCVCCIFIYKVEYTRIQQRVYERWWRCIPEAFCSSLEMRGRRREGGLGPCGGGRGGREWMCVYILRELPPHLPPPPRPDMLPREWPH